MVTIFITAAKPVSNQLNSGWGASSVPTGGASVDDDDGGWGMGPPGVGSGWMGKFIYRCIKLYLVA